MKKEQLMKLLTEYDRVAAFRLMEKNPRIPLLSAFLKTPAIAALANNADISFSQFENYLLENKHNPAELFPPDYFYSGKRSVKLFIKFKYGIMDADLKVAAKKIPAGLTGPFSKLPEHLRHDFYNKYLSNQDMARLAITSSFFKQDTKAAAIWIEKLIQLGCDRNLVNQLRSANVIQDYKKLYKNVKSFFGRDKINLTALWQLLCLSGELAAVKYGIEKGEIDKAALRGEVYVEISSDYPGYGRNEPIGEYMPIHFLAFAGQVEGLKLLEHFADMKALSHKLGCNILHMAARGNSPAAMEYAVLQGIDANVADRYNGNNAIHHACATGSKESLLYALKVLKVDKDKVNAMGLNALLVAVYHNNQKGVLFALDELKHSSDSVKRRGYQFGNALHIAAAYSDVAMLKFLHNKLKIPYLSRDNLSNTILHYAATNSPEMIRYILKEQRMLLYSEEISGYTAIEFAINKNKKREAVVALREAGYDPNHRDSHHRTAFDYLDQAGNLSAEQKAELRAALECDIQLNKAPSSANEEASEKRAHKP